MSNYHRNRAWEAGYEAARVGKPASSCTRKPGTVYFDDWHDGYDNARLRAGLACPPGEE